MPKRASAECRQPPRLPERAGFRRLGAVTDSNAVLSDSNARLADARRLTTRRARHESGLFLAEGAQAVREGLRAKRVRAVFATSTMLQRHAAMLTGDVPVDEISDRAAATLSETVHPQGLVAVCAIEPEAQPSIAPAGLVVLLVDANDPGNAGTILRSADAAGADQVIFAGGSVDPYNGKSVRASAGSLFHVGVRTGVSALVALAELKRAGLLCLATSGEAATSLDDMIESNRLAAPTAWVFGNEARGLPDDVLAAADVTVRVPIYGQAESLNLAAAAAICLYASAREHAR